MKPSRVKPISYLKAHASEVLRDLNEQREAVVITQNGVARAVMLDIESYEQTQETMALLKILALGNGQVERGRITDAGEVVRRLKERLSHD